MPSHRKLLARYKHLREVGLALNNRLMKVVSRKDMDVGGKKLGILKKNVLVLDTEDEIAVFADYCIYDVRRQGMNAVERFLAESPPPPDSDEMVLLQAMRQARFSLFAVESVEPGVGVHVRDLLREEPLFIVDVGFSRSTRAGMVLAARVMAPDGIVCTTGAALPAGVLTAANQATFLQAMAAGFKGKDLRHLSPEKASEFTATVIRTCLRQGAAERIEYVEPRDRKWSDHRGARRPGPPSAGRAPGPQ
jgi:hypothetical protein